MTDPLVAFLKARLDEDDAAARRVGGSWRVLADIAAKRLLIKEYEGEAWVSKQQEHRSGWTEGGLSARRTLLEAFAKAHEDHPDYRDKWTDSEMPWAD